MLSLEHSRRQEPFTPFYHLEAQLPYPDLNMNVHDSFDSVASFASLPFSYYENPALFVEAPQDSLKFDSLRSSSAQGSLLHSSHSDFPPSLHSSASLPSASSSTIGSPYSSHSHTISGQDTWTSNQGLGFDPTIVNNEAFPAEYVGAGIDPELSFQVNDKIHDGNFVDPSLIEAPRNSYADFPASYGEQSMYPNMSQSYTVSPGASPTHSPQMYQAYPNAHFSPSLPYHNFTQPEYINRRQSVASYHSGHSQSSPMSGSADFDEEHREKGRCPFSECGRVFKDLKAHMLTHQPERPEKCPILNCEYNQKGFARKYDKNRHTLTHYKGTMVCGFCTGSGSAAEKSFNRADVFKRHLTSVHGVEQAPPNSRKRSPTSSTRKLTSYCEDATGKCSTCSATFVNAQDFYEHLDDCVLRVVQQEEPSEAINQHHLHEISVDQEVKETMERNMVKTEESYPSIEEIDEDDEDEDEEDEENDDFAGHSRAIKGGSNRNARATGPSRAVLNGGISKAGRPVKHGLTHSKGGVPLIGRGRKRRKHYPPAWGMSAEKMQMKKRVLCVYDGERRLWKDDLMMHNEFEVRMKLQDGKSYVTDLDIETLKRAEAFHNATEEERGPWVHEPMPSYDLEALMS